MRCTQCGLPLSPSRNSCPRCGTPINMPNSARVAGPPSSASTSTPQLTFPTQQPQAPFEDRQSLSLAESTQQVSVQESFPTSRSSSPLASYPTNDFSTKPSHNASPSTRRSSKTTTIGLTTAGLCIIAGSLLLVFVYLVGQGSLPAGTTSPGNTHTLSTGKINQTATAAYLSQPTVPALTPTPTLPGQNQLDMSVLSTDFNNIQPLTDFKVNQTIYVVLTLHPGGTNHAVCLNWFLNDLSVKKFGFEVDPTSNYHYYSYTTMLTTGSGYVEISLASTTACSDDILAKKLYFTVSM